MYPSGCNETARYHTGGDPATGERVRYPRIMADPGESAPTEPTGRITGVGRVFFQGEGPEGNKLELWEPKRNAPP